MKTPLLSLLLFAALSPAAPLTVGNASFEDVTDQYGAPWQGTCGSCGSITVDPLWFPGGIPDGLRTLYSNAAVGVWQVLTDTLQPSTLYTLNVWVGDRTDTDWGGAQLELRSGPAFPGSTLLASVLNPVTPADGEFALATLQYLSPSVVTPGQNLIILLRGGGGVQAHFDQVSLDATGVPEPGTWALMVGAGALVLARRRR